MIRWIIGRVACCVFRVTWGDAAVTDARGVSVRAARRTSRELYRLFGRLGTREHPRGRVLGAYRNAHRGLRDVFRRGGPLMRFEVEEVLAGLRREVTLVAVETLGQAAELGQVQARAELGARGIEVGAGSLPPDLTAALGAWLGEVDRQVAMVRGVVATGGGVALVIGDEARGGVLQPGMVVREGARWLTTVAMGAWWDVVQAAPVVGFEWMKQAVAAIDERTTDCCLRVHGQVVPLDERFTLTGTPRYADRLEWSPFHWYCRTSVTLVTAEDADDELTDRMRAAAAAELARRAALQAQIDAVKAELVGLGEVPDIRHRAGDSEEVQGLRDELRGLYEELRGEIHPASGVGG